MRMLAAHAQPDLTTVIIRCLIKLLDLINHVHDGWKRRLDLTKQRDRDQGVADGIHCSTCNNNI